MDKWFVTVRTISSYTQLVEAADEDAAKEVARKHSNQNKINDQGTVEMNAMRAAPDSDQLHPGKLLR
jgi:hypothetical protein